MGFTSAAGGRYRAFLLLQALMLLTLFCSQPATAQSEKTGLDMYLLDGYNSIVKPGESNIFFIELRNSGNIDLTNIVFSNTAPDDWIVSFDPAKIELLTRGSYQSIQVDVRPPYYTDKGSYNLSLIAKSDEIRQAVILYTRIESSTSIWLWIGVVIAVVVIVVFLYVFFRLNRQQ